MFWRADRFRKGGDTIESITPHLLDQASRDAGFLLSRDERSIVYSIDAQYISGVYEARERAKKK